METQVNTPATVTPRSIGIKWGLISAIVSVVLFLVMVFTGQNAFDSSFSWKSLIAPLISVVIIVLAHKNYKESGDGFMSYGQGVGIAFWIALVSILIYATVTYLYVKFIDEAAMAPLIEQQAEELSKKGLSDDDVEMSLSMMRILYWPMAIIAGLFFGVLFGLIVSIFTQKKNPEPAF